MSAFKNTRPSDIFAARHETIRFAREHCVSWSKFAASLVSQFERKSRLSEKQWAALTSMVEKVKARQEKRAAKHAEQEAAPKADLARIVAALTHARVEGKLKYPKLRMQDASGQKVVLCLAGSGAKQPGSVNITDGCPFGENVWFGRISVDGELQASRSITADVRELLEQVNADPMEAAKIQGQRTGNCYCCGRELTNSLSIELGIGPVCREKWGF